MLLRDLLSAYNPIYWYFWIGLLLVLIVATFRKGVLPTMAAWLARRRAPGVLGPLRGKEATP
jgi:branched-chain amino acid transport system permease protein